MPKAAGVDPGQRQLNGPQTTGRGYRNLSGPEYGMRCDEDVHTKIGERELNAPAKRTERPTCMSAACQNSILWPPRTAALRVRPLRPITSVTGWQTTVSAARELVAGTRWPGGGVVVRCRSVKIGAAQDSPGQVGILQACPSEISAGQVRRADHQICARRGLCSHAPVGVQLGGYGALAN
jgi:hypothetical protein